MTPIYFPFTFLSERDYQDLGLYFRQLIAFTPLMDRVPKHMRQWVRDGFLHLKNPFSSDDRRVDALIRDYRTWANLHGLSALSVYKGFENTIPFFNDGSPLRIRSEIKGYNQKTDKDHGQDQALYDRLFLQLAQEYDSEQEQLAHGFERFNEMEKRFADLLEPDQAKKTNGRTPPEAGAYKTTVSSLIEKRLTAWSRLFQGDPCDGGFFVTHGPSVRSSLEEKFPEMVKALVVDAYPTDLTEGRPKEPWKAAFMKECHDLAKDSWNSKPASTSIGDPDHTQKTRVSLSVYIVPECPPLRFISGCAAQMQAPPARTKPARYRNTLIGVLRDSNQGS